MEWLLIVGLLVLVIAGSFMHRKQQAEFLKLEREASRLRSDCSQAQKRVRDLEAELQTSLERIKLLLTKIDR